MIKDGIPELINERDSLEDKSRDNKGKYCLGGELGLCFMFEHKPSAWKRFWMKHLLGWQWHDI